MGGGGVKKATKKVTINMEEQTAEAGKTYGLNTYLHLVRTL